uniref:protein-tyrosine-phosphatase n=1 Tax=Panagrellus redivivus TaxID=6233 RepID=A0A7E4WCT3_PANRE
MNRAYLLAAFAELDRQGHWNKVYNKLSNETLKQESNLNLTLDEAQKEENFAKNRYQNVLPYDNNRIKLTNLGPDQTDFVNASPLKVPFAGRNYVMTQGPLKETAEDFWQMVWEQDSHVVVMLNNVMEKGYFKCYPYYVDEKEPIKTFGDFKIELIADTGCKDYRVRKIRLSSTNERHDLGDREITHLHFTNWPDFGVPDRTAPFLEFLEKSNDAVESTGNDLPIIVHCSAGIGRSGAFVVADALITHLKQVQGLQTPAGDAESAPVPKTMEEFVLYIRKHRRGLIQTPDQLRFAWAAINEWIESNSESAKPEENGTTEVKDPSTEAPAPRKRHSTSEATADSREKRRQKIQEMRDRIRRVEQSQNRSWLRRFLGDVDSRFWLGGGAVAAGVTIAYVYLNYFSK